MALKIASSKELKEKYEKLKKQSENELKELPKAEKVQNDMSPNKMPQNNAKRNSTTDGNEFAAKVKEIKSYIETTDLGIKKVLSHMATIDPELWSYSCMYVPRRKATERQKKGYYVHFKKLDICFYAENNKVAKRRVLQAICGLASSTHASKAADLVKHAVKSSGLTEITESDKENNKSDLEVKNKAAANEQNPFDTQTINAIRNELNQIDLFGGKKRPNKTKCKHFLRELEKKSIVGKISSEHKNGKLKMTIAGTPYTVSVAATNDAKLKHCENLAYQALMCAVLDVCDYKPKQRTYFQTICENCGGIATVPFEPKQDRPVLCSECFANRKNAQNT